MNSNFTDYYGKIGQTVELCFRRPVGAAWGSLCGAIAVLRPKESKMATKEKSFSREHDQPDYAVHVSAAELQDIVSDLSQPGRIAEANTNLQAHVNKLWGLSPEAEAEIVFYVDETRSKAL